MTGGGYNLFEMEDAEVRPIKKVDSSANISSVSVSEASDDQIPEVSALKNDEKIIETIGKQGDKKEIIDSAKAAEKVVENAQDSAGQKKVKTIEKIVIFYLDNTFKEYYPEN
jgi:hypothetical protein